MDTAETPKMIINSAPEVDELSTDISENIIMETKDTESIEEACEFVSNSARKVCEVPTEAEQKEFFGGASSMKNENLIESVDDSGRNGVVCENTPHTVSVTKSRKKIIACTDMEIHKLIIGN